MERCQLCLGWLGVLQRPSKEEGEKDERAINFCVYVIVNREGGMACDKNQSSKILIVPASHGQAP